MLTYGTNPHYDRLFDRLNEICSIGALLKHLDDANREELDPAALGALGQLIARLSQDAVEDLEKLPQSLQTRATTHETAPQTPKPQDQDPDPGQDPDQVQDPDPAKTPALAAAVALHCIQKQGGDSDD